MMDGHSGDEELPAKINFIPSVCHEVASWDHSIICAGCYRVFPCQVDDNLKYPAPKYFEHCVNRCKKYAALNLTRECSDCWSVFIDENLYKSHLGICNVIAERNLNVYKIRSTCLDYSQDWKGGEPTVNEDSSGDESDLDLTNNKEAWVVHIPKQSLKCKKFREKILCLGCGKAYPGTKVRERVIEVDDTEVEKDAIIGRRDYYNHCVFKCQKYQELNLSCLCLRCNKFFLDPDEFSTHKMNSCNTELAPKSTQEVHKCPCCTKTFLSLGSLKQHVVKVHDASQVEEKVLESLNLGSRIPCDICSKVFLSHCGFEKHRKSHETPNNPGTSSSDWDVCVDSVATGNQVTEITTGPNTLELPSTSGESSKSEVPGTFEQLNTEVTSSSQISYTISYNEVLTATTAQEAATIPSAIQLANAPKISISTENPFEAVDKLSYSCDVCSKSFIDERRLHIHVQAKHASEESCYTVVSEQSTSTAANIDLSSAIEQADHGCEEVHQGKELRTQDHIGGFGEAEMMAIIDSLSPITISPSTIRLPGELNQCSHCYSTFATLLSLKVHFLDKHYRKEFDCTNCSYSFPTITALSTHFIQCHEYSAKLIAKRCRPAQRRGKSPKNHPSSKKLKAETSSNIEDQLKVEKQTDVNIKTVELVDKPRDTSTSSTKESRLEVVNDFLVNYLLDDLSVDDDNFCLGCREKFPRGGHISRLYHHCIFECDEYAKLGLKRACNICRGIFMNQQLLDEHKMNFCQVIPLD